jgi:hypothetical protein
MSGQNRLARELRVNGEVDRTLRRRERVRRREDRRAPRRREDAQAAGRLQRVAGVGVVRVVEAQLLEERDVDGVCGGMEELRAEIDRDALPLVVDHPRIAVTADLGSRLEDVDVEGVGKEVGRGHAARTGADDGHALALRRRSVWAGSSAVGRPSQLAGAERRQADRALEDVAAGQ